MRAENISDDPGANYVRAFMAHRNLRTAARRYEFRIVCVRPDTKHWRAIPELGRRIIFAINEDKNGRVLVAAAGGLFASAWSNESSFARVGGGEDRSPGDSVRAITAAGGSTYVASFGYGVEKLDGARRTLVWPEANADEHLREVVSLGTDPNGGLVIGTASAGAFVFDGKRTSSDSALDKLKGAGVSAIMNDGDAFWLATDKGLYLSQAGQLKEIVAGVNARTVVVVADNSRKQIWCATVGNGLMKVALDDQFGAIVSRLDVEQGLPSQRVFAVLSERNADGSESVIAGTNRGLVRYEPGHVKPTVLPARIISQRIHEQSELRSGLQLDYPQNSLLLDVTAISSRTFPEQFQYAFALSDSSGKVIREKLSHDSQFAMEKLKPGTYKVLARAFTKDLTPATPLSFEFTVSRAPFPLTSTALGVLLLLALIALGWGYFQNRRIHRTSAALASANRELADARLQLANETEAERRRIARDLARPNLSRSAKPGVAGRSAAGE